MLKAVGLGLTVDTFGLCCLPEPGVADAAEWPLAPAEGAWRPFVARCGPAVVPGGGMDARHLEIVPGIRRRARASLARAHRACAGSNAHATAGGQSCPRTAGGTAKFRMHEALSRPPMDRASCWRRSRGSLLPCAPGCEPMSPSSRGRPARVALQTRQGSRNERVRRGGSPASWLRTGARAPWPARPRSPGQISLGKASNTRNPERGAVPSVRPPPNPWLAAPATWAAVRAPVK